MTSKRKVQFKKDDGIKALIQDDENEIIIDPTEITLLDLINMFGEESARRGLQYMISLERADKNFREANSEEIMLEALKEMTDADEITDGMEQLSDNWSEEMEKQGIGID